MYAGVESIATRRARWATRAAVTLLALAGAWRLWSLPTETPGEPALPAVLSAEDRATAQRLGPSTRERLVSTDPIAQQEAVDELVAVLREQWPDDHRRAFLERVTPGALHAAIEHCVPPSVTVAQAALESGWGRSGLARKGRNLFGIKAGAAKGGMTLPTREVEEGRERLARARFATFEDWEASLEHHNRLLAGDARYAEARVHWKHWPLFLEQLAPVYASDPSYVSLVSQLVRDYRLDAWDELVQAAAAKHAECDWSG